MHHGEFSNVLQDTVVVLLSVEVNGFGLVGNADSQQNVPPSEEACAHATSGHFGTSSNKKGRGGGNTVGVARFGKVRVHGRI